MPKGSTILIVEDNPELRLDLGDLFELEGYDVHTVGGGHEALALLEDTPVDLVVSDYEMPGMNGGELLTEIRASQLTARVPFILVSGGTPPLIGGDALFCFLRKPFSIEMLLRAVAHLLVLRRTEYHAAD